MDSMESNQPLPNPPTQDNTMNSQSNESIKRILAAAATPIGADQLAAAGTVRGQYGVTAWRAMHLIRMLVADGRIIQSYDSLNCPLYRAA